MAVRRYRVLLPLLAVLLALLGAVGGFCAREHYLSGLQQAALARLEESEGAYREGVLVLSDTTPERAAQLATELGATLRLGELGSYATLTLPKGESVRELFESRKYRDLLPELSLDGISEAQAIVARPDYTVTDNRYIYQTNLNYIHLGDVWKNTKGRFASGERVKVAIIDSGIDIDHPEFRDSGGNLILSPYSYNVYSEQSVSGGGWSVIDDERGHGTAVAGIIAAQMNGSGVVGIAPEVELLILKANIPGEGKYYTSDITFAMQYAIAQGVHVINISIGGEAPNTGSTLQSAVAKNIIVVAAAGNESTNTLSYPACDANVIGVGALANSSFSLASYSNYGENSDLVAPGTNIYTTARGGGYAYVDGTSFSSPTVAAAVALYIAYNGVTPYAKLREHLLASCADLGTSGEDEKFGFGALDVLAFVKGKKLTVTLQYRSTGAEPGKLTVLEGHTLQALPTPENIPGLTFEGWYLDPSLTQKLTSAAATMHIFQADTTLYARWLGDQEGDFDYRITSSNTVEILAYRGSQASLEIPKTLGGKNVSSIGYGAFLDLDTLTCMDLPSGVRTVQANAFTGCENLKLLYLHSGSVARGILSKASCGGIAANLETILIRATLTSASTYIRSNFPHNEDVVLDGVSYILYAKTAPVWQESAILTQRVACVSDGLRRDVCTCCGAQRDVTLPRHTAGAWGVLLAATCLEEGSEIRYCTDCAAEVERRTVKAFGHTPRDAGEDHPALCTEGGYVQHHCATCSASYRVNTAPALGHAEGDWITDALPTKREDGAKHTVCTRCSITMRTETLAARTHLLEFDADVASIGKNAAKSDYATIKRALEFYAALSESDASLVAEEYTVLQAAIEQYNAVATARGASLKSATEIAADLLSELYEAVGGIWYTWKQNLPEEGAK